MRKQFQTFFLTAFAGVLSALPAIATAQQPASADAAPIVEQGKFTLHKFEQAIGQETYEIRRDGDSLL